MCGTSRSNQPRRNPKEVLANIKEAIEGYLAAFPEELDQLKQKRELVEITV